MPQHCVVHSVFCARTAMATAFINECGITRELLNNSHICLFVCTCTHYAYFYKFLHLVFLYTCFFHTRWPLFKCHPQGWTDIAYHTVSSNFLLSCSFICLIVKYCSRAEYSLRHVIRHNLRTICWVRDVYLLGISLRISNKRCLRPNCQPARIVAKCCSLRQSPRICH